MITTNLSELMLILHGDHANPHNILGMHCIRRDDTSHSIVRVYNPDAAFVDICSRGTPATWHRLVPEHQGGFFTGVLPLQDHFHYQLRFTNQDGHSWESYDPYSFPPILSDLDTHLFSQGTHYEIYNKLGATPLTINGIDGVLFALWAPNAKRVSVVGDFNHWNGHRHPMRNLGGSGLWELFVPGLADFDRYKFEIKTHTGEILQKADPYATFAELRPYTASRVYNLDGYAWGDKKWLDKRRKKDPLAGPVNVYELHPGSWRRHEDRGENGFYSWAELTATLIPYVKDMGYTHIELMPVTEYPFDGSWGYQVTGFFAPTSRFGTPHDFMAFIDACHQADIGVLLDWVPAHFPKDAHGLARFDGTHLYEHADPRKGEHVDWGTLIFNYGRNEVKNFLIASALFWLDKYHIDGLRVDAVASMLYLDYGRDSGQWIPNEYGGRENDEAVEFIKHMNSVVGKRHPHALMIAEESTAWEGVTKPVEAGGLGFSLKWNMGWMNDFLRYMEEDSVNRKYHHHLLTFSMVYAYSERYVLVLSHDEVVHGKRSLVDKMPGDLWQKFANLRAAYAFMMAHPGKKLLFMGGEFAQFREWSEMRSLDWFLVDEFEHHMQMQAYVRDLNRLYAKERAFWQKDFDQAGFEWISVLDNERSIVSFYRVAEKARGAGQEYLIFVCNFTEVPHLDYRVGLPVDGVCKEIFNSDAEAYGGSGVVNPGRLKAQQHLCDGREYSVPLKLPPLGAAVLKMSV